MISVLLSKWQGFFPKDAIFVTTIKNKFYKRIFWKANDALKTREDSLHRIVTNTCAAKLPCNLIEKFCLCRRGNCRNLRRRLFRIVILVSEQQCHIRHCLLPLQCSRLPFVHVIQWTLYIYPFHGKSGSVLRSPSGSYSMLTAPFHGYPEAIFVLFQVENRLSQRKCPQSVTFLSQRLGTSAIN